MLYLNDILDHKPEPYAIHNAKMPLRTQEPSSPQTWNSYNFCHNSYIIAETETHLFLRLLWNKFLGSLWELGCPQELEQVLLYPTLVGCSGGGGCLNHRIDNGSIPKGANLGGLRLASPKGINLLSYWVKGYIRKNKRKFLLLWKSKIKIERRHDPWDSSVSHACAHKNIVTMGNKLSACSNITLCMVDLCYFHHTSSHLLAFCGFSCKQNSFSATA